MAATTVAIAQHLNIAEFLIAEVQEWAHVLFVRFTSGRPRFVSKKVINMNITRTEAAHKIKEALEADTRDKYSVNIWEKGGRCRLYIKDLGYRNRRAQDQGFFGINTDGSFNWDNLKNNSSALDVIRRAIEGLDILSDEGAKAMTQSSRRPLTKQESWAAYHKQNQVNDYYYGAADEESW